MKCEIKRIERSEGRNYLGRQLCTMLLCTRAQNRWVVRRSRTRECKSRRRMWRKNRWLRLDKHFVDHLDDFHYYGNLI